MSDDIQPAEARYRTLKNGAVYDMERKRIVDSTQVTTKITSSNAVAIASQRIERKRQAIEQAANRIAAEGGAYDGVGHDWVEAIAEAAMMTALNQDSRNQIKAAEMLLRETGLAEKQAQAEQPAVHQAVDAVVMLLVARQPDADVVDGQVADE